MKGENADTKKPAMRSAAKRLAFTALFAALCCVGTMFIVIPLPHGYFNAGDVFVLLAGWCMGPVFGGVAAGLGSCLADILSGYILYAPVTFFVKGIDAVASYFVWRALRLLVTKDNLDFLARIGAAVVGEALMVLGYFLFETAMYGVAGGAASLVGNALQGTFGVVCSVLLVSIFVPPEGGARVLFPAHVPAAPEKGSINRESAPHRSRFTHRADTDFAPKKYRKRRGRSDSWHSTA